MRGHQPEKRRIVLFFERRDAASWLAHLDTMRLFERALNRAGWPLSWTEDAFNPRPEIVFALPAGVGIETCRDPVEVKLDGRGRAFEIEKGIASLNRSFPAGVRIVDYREAGPADGSLMARVRAARYRLEAKGIGPAYRKAFAHGGPVKVTRQRKRKRVEVDLAPRILEVAADGPDRILLTGGAGSSGHLRTDLLLEALILYGGLAREAAQGARVVRLAVFLDGCGPGQGIIT